MNAKMTNVPRRKIVAMALATTGCLLLAACGGGSSNNAAAAAGSTANVAADGVNPADVANPAAASDPCSLLTQAEVETAVGQHLSAGLSDPTLGDCSWSSSDFTANVDLTVSTWSAIQTAATANGHTPDPIPGIGDEALNNDGLLSVRSGDTGFLLTIGGPTIDSSPDSGLAQEEVLAAAVLGRI